MFCAPCTFICTLWKLGNGNERFRQILKELFGLLCIWSKADDRQVMSIGWFYRWFCWWTISSESRDTEATQNVGIGWRVRHSLINVMFCNLSAGLFECLPTTFASLQYDWWSKLFADYYFIKKKKQLTNCSSASRKSRPILLSKNWGILIQSRKSTDFYVARQMSLLDDKNGQMKWPDLVIQLHLCCC